MNQEFLVKGYLKKQWYAPATITREPEQREQVREEREFVGKGSSRRME